MSSVEDLLTPRAPSYKFETIGDTIKGTVTHAEVRPVTDIKTGEIKRWDDGNEQQQIVITLATDLRDPDVPNDEGERRIFAQHRMRGALVEALKRCGPGTKFEVGGTLAVKYVSNGTASAVGFTPPKLYAADYRPPANAGVDSLLDGPSATAPASKPADTDLL